MIEKTTHRRSYAFQMWNTQIDSTRLKMMKVTAAYLGEQKNESKLKWMRGGVESERAVQKTFIWFLLQIICSRFFGWCCDFKCHRYFGQVARASVGLKLPLTCSHGIAFRVSMTWEKKCLWHKQQQRKKTNLTSSQVKISLCNLSPHDENAHRAPCEW